jgi:hypothetical protein
MKYRTLFSSRTDRFIFHCAELRLGKSQVTFILDKYPLSFSSYGFCLHINYQLFRRLLYISCSPQVLFDAIDGLQIKYRTKKGRSKKETKKEDQKRRQRTRALKALKSGLFRKPLFFKACIKVFLRSWFC